MKIVIFFKKNLYTSIVLLTGILFIIILLFYFSFNYFRLWQLLLKFKIEFFFLLISGYFLYSFRYAISNIELSFNAFIIYISNIILYINPNSDEIGLINYNLKALVLILFFIFIYFLIQIPIYIFFKKFTIYNFELILVRILLWTVIIFIINYIIYFFKINIINLQFKDILLIPLILTSHIIIKILFLFLEKSLRKKYFNFILQGLSSLLIDIIFILFSILIGSIYRNINILNTALFISFLAIVVSLMKYFISKNSMNIIFYYLNSFVNFRDLYDLTYSPILPLDIKIEINKVINSKIKYFIFIVFKIIDNNNINFNNIYLNNEDLKKYKFYFYKKDYICFILPLISSEDIKKIYNIKKKLSINSKIMGCYCAISRKNWNYIDINYFFKLLYEILEKKSRYIKDKDFILSVKEDYIFF